MQVFTTRHAVLAVLPKMFLGTRMCARNICHEKLKLCLIRLKYSGLFMVVLENLAALKIAFYEESPLKSCKFYSAASFYLSSDIKKDESG